MVSLPSRSFSGGGSLVVRGRCFNAEMQRRRGAEGEAGFLATENRRNRRGGGLCPFVNNGIISSKCLETLV